MSVRIRISRNGTGEAPRPCGDAAAGLSPRQREIFDLIQQGASNKEIAYRLGIAQGTVKQHIVTIFRKLGVSNRTMAVFKGVQVELQDEPRPDAAALPAAPQPWQQGLDVWRLPLSVVSLSFLPPDGPASRIRAAWTALAAFVAAQAVRLDALASHQPGSGLEVWFGTDAQAANIAERAAELARRTADAFPQTCRAAVGSGLACLIMGAHDDGDDPVILRAPFADQARAAASVLKPGHVALCGVTQALQARPPVPSEFRAVVRPRLARAIADIRAGKSRWVAIEGPAGEARRALLATVAEQAASLSLPVMSMHVPARVSAEAITEAIREQIGAAPGDATAPVALVMASGWLGLVRDVGIGPLGRPLLIVGLEPPSTRELGFSIIDEAGRRRRISGLPQPRPPAAADHDPACALREMLDAVEALQGVSAQARDAARLLACGIEDGMTCDGVRAELTGQNILAADGRFVSGALAAALAATVPGSTPLAPSEPTP